MAAHRLQNLAEGLELPLLVRHGTGDVITDAEGSRQLFDRAASTDKTLKLYEGLYHDLFQEPEHPEVTADMLAWLNERADRS